MKLFSFGYKKESLTLILDIQSSIVRGALVSGIGSPKPVIIHSQVSDVPFRADIDSSYLIKRTIQATKEVIEDTYRFVYSLDGKSYHRKLRKVHFVMSSPWITSIARVVSMKSDTEVTVTKKLIQHIISEERDKMITDKSILDVIEEKVFDVKLNGYSIADWQEKEASLIDISYSSSYANKIVVKKFIECCDRHIHKSGIVFHSSLLLQYIGLQNIYENMKNYCIIYLHGELTDVVLVRHGFPIFFGSFPYGVQTLIRKIAKNSNTDFGAAESMLSMQVGEHVDSNSFAANSTILSDVTTGWKNELTKMIGDQLRELGSDCDVIVSSRTHEDYFIAEIKKIFEKTRVQSLSTDLVQSKVPFTNDSEHIRLLALYTNAINHMHAGE